MTVVLESYQSIENKLITAEIQQHKYEKAFELVICETDDIESCFAHTIFHNYYLSIPYARKALKRQEKYFGKFEKVKE